MRKHITALLLGLIAVFTATAHNQTDSIVIPFCISDGYFFDKDNFRDVAPGGSTSILMKDPDGNRIIGIYLPEGFALDNSVITKAIPAERVKHAQQLLRDYNGRHPAKTNKYKGIGVKIGEPFISFNYIDTDNRVWNNEAVKGKVYVLNVWQKECGPCREEMPVLSTWKEKYPDVVFLSASRHNTEEIAPIAQRHNFTWTHLQEASDIIALVGQQGFPLTIVVDEDGIVRYAKTGASDENQSEAVRAIDELIKYSQINK